MGFEPTVGYKPTPIFKTGAINQLDHLSISSCDKLYLIIFLYSLSRKIILFLLIFYTKNIILFTIFITLINIVIFYFLFTAIASASASSFESIYSDFPFSTGLAYTLDVSLPYIPLITKPQLFSSNIANAKLKSLPVSL